MRRVLLLTMLLLAFGGAGVYAHLTGAFSNYLLSIVDVDSTEQLRQEIDATKAQIESMKPRLAEQTARFAENRAAAAEQLLLLDSMGVDFRIGLLQQSGGPTELMADYWVLERYFRQYVQQLDELYRENAALSGEERKLRSYNLLLEKIEQGLEARNQFLASNADVHVEQLANYLDIDWTAEVEEELIGLLDRDRITVAEGADEWGQQGIRRRSTC
ncbi:hypothetical protein [Cohnella faecalis]|uniref:Uncharacterized protein n=1 Tax=Cohnella faecalis TaxID=2315694 RepID=A0A398CNW3_9BACL|nr:hypothetical protein [Cohnella faecalis]RIE04042.1 hypothetical protein D3H35_08805 [Cohnella faecalis]